MRIPDHLRKQLDPREQLVAIELRDGRIIDEVLVDSTGIIQGFVIGGQTGVTKEGLEDVRDDICAVRRRDGIVGRLGLTRWKR